MILDKKVEGKCRITFLNPPFPKYIKVDSKPIEFDSTKYTKIIAEQNQEIEKLEEQLAELSEPIALDYEIYIVKSGDNLTKIAKLYNITVEKLVEDNNIANKNVIEVGQELKIYDVEPLEYIMPTSNMRKTSSYGIRNGRPHKGVDYGGVVAGKSGDPLYATCDGIVTRVDLKGSSGYGNRVMVYYPTLSKTFLYAHILENIPVKNGASVKKGQVVGYMGGSGGNPYKKNYYVPHLHLEVLNGKVNGSIVSKKSDGSYLTMKQLEAKGLNNPETFLKGLV